MLTVLIALLGLTQASPAADETPFVGTIVLEHEDGTRTTPKSGSIHMYGKGRGRSNVVASIENGAFQTSFSDAMVDVAEIELDGVACWALPPWGWDEIPPSAELVARRVKPSWLRVLDAENGRDLDYVFIYDSNGSAAERMDLVMPPARSPISVPLFGAHDDRIAGWIGLRCYRITSQGFETQRIWIDPSEGGTRTFELAQEARLQILVPGAEEYAGELFVQLVQEGTNWALPLREVTREGDTTIDGLAAGKWRVQLSEQSETLATQTVELHAGCAATTHFETIADIGKAPPRFELRGTLRFSGDAPDPLPALRFVRTPGWREWMGLTIKLDSSSFAQDPKDASMWHWYAGPADAGTWTASLAGTPWTQTFELTGDQPTELVVKDAPTHIRATANSEGPDSVAGNSDPASALTTTPIEVRFDLVDQETGLVIAPEVARPWRSEDPSKRVLSRAGEHWAVIAPEGALDLTLDSPSYLSGPYTLVVAKGPDVQRVPIRLPRKLFIRAYDGDARIGAPEIQEVLRPRVEALEGEDRFLRSQPDSVRENEFHVFVAGGGRYRVTLAPNDRYAPHAPVEVEVKAGEPGPVAVLHLQRAAK